MFGLLFICLPFTGNAQNIKDSNGQLSIEVDKKDATSEDSADGYLKLKISGGKAPYKLTYFSPYSIPSTVSGEKINLSNLKAGSYLFVVQDSFGKSITKEIVITNNK